MNTHPTIEAFIKKFSPCCRGAAFARSCKTPNEGWLRIEARDLLWIATREGVLTDRELRLFAIWAARQVQHLAKDPRSTAAPDVAERYVNGQADARELEEARKNARAAYVYATDAADAADVAYGAAFAAFAACAANAAYAAYATADAADTIIAAYENQAKWLRANTQPNFERALLS